MGRDSFVGGCLNTTPVPKAGDSAAMLIGDTLNHFTSIDCTVGLIESALGLPCAPTGGEQSSAGLLLSLQEIRRNAGEIKLRIDMILKALSG